MNLNKSTITKSIFQFTLVFSTILFISCAENKGAGTKDKTPSSTSKVAPAIDINAAVVAGNIEAVKQHIEVGTDINQKDPMGGSSPLITACLYEQKEIAKLLIADGADMNFKNNDGSTPLHVAAFFCKPEMVKLLIENKADKSIRNNYKNTAYETVTSPFNTVKSVYEQMKQMLEPMGVKLDLDYIEKTRPVVADMLK